MDQNEDTSNIVKNKLEDKDIRILANVYRNSAASTDGAYQGLFQADN